MGAAMTTIASVSLASPLETIADELGRSFGENGFAVVRDHGIPQDLIDEAEAVSKAFFALPDAVKRAYKIDGEKVTWIPAVDTSRIVLTGQIVGIVALLVLRSIFKRKG